MKFIVQKMLLFFALTLFSATVSSAAENSNDTFEQVQSDYSYHNIQTSKQNTNTQKNTEYGQTTAERMKLIEVNMYFVKIVAYLYAFSLFMIIVLMWITHHNAKDIVTIVGLLSVIFGTLLLVLMISNTEQMTAPIGIFGAIAGYLFGSGQRKEDQKENKQEAGKQEKVTTEPT